MKVSKSISKGLSDIKTESTMTRENNLAIASTLRERICMKFMEYVFVVTEIMTGTIVRTPIVNLSLPLKEVI
jgi:hypothetical protein